MAANGAGFIYYLNMASIQESSVTISGESAELQKSGVRNNIVPKTGGNKFSGFLFVGGGNHSTQADNLTDSLKSQRPDRGQLARHALRHQSGLGRPDHQRQAVVLQCVSLQHRNRPAGRPLLQRDADGVDLHA